jgi:putative ABC transport system substrate-binding protein
MSDMRRREFITLIGGAAVAWPLAGRAQQAGKQPIIGFLGANSPSLQSQWTAAFEQRLRELGWIEGRNVAIEYRWAEGRFDRSPALAAELVQRKVDVIVTHATANVIAAMQATSLIPIVFAAVADPVGNKLVASLARPGGNVTGLSNQIPDLVGKRLELLRELVPGLRRLAMMVHVGVTDVVAELGEVQAAGRTLGLDVAALEIRRSEDIAPAIEALRGRADGIYVQADPLFTSNRVRLNSLALSARLPTIHGTREQVDAGALLSYGTNLTDLFRRAGDFVDKILRGTKPADIPVEQPTKFDLVVNLWTAKALGLEVPPKLPARDHHPRARFRHTARGACEPCGLRL